MIFSPNWSYFCKFATCKSLRTTQTLNFLVYFLQFFWHNLIFLLILDLVAIENTKKFAPQMKPAAEMAAKTVYPCNMVFCHFDTYTTTECFTIKLNKQKRNVCRRFKAEKPHTTIEVHKKMQFRLPNPSII